MVESSLWDLTQTSRQKKKLQRECDRFIRYLDEIRDFQYSTIYAKVEQLRKRVGGRKTKEIEIQERKIDEQKELLKKVRRQATRRKRDIRRNHNIRTARSKRYL